MSYFAHPTAVIDKGAVIGEGTKIWHFSHIMPNARIGERCNFGQNVFIAAGVAIGDGVKIQNNVSVYSGVELEDDVFLGPSMVFTNVTSPRSFMEQKNYAATKVGRGATIGANATVVCGNTIGAYALIGAGAVITSDVPAFALYVGVPAKQIGWVSKAGETLSFDESGRGKCPKGGDTYQIKGSELIRITD